MNPLEYNQCPKSKGTQLAKEEVVIKKTFSEIIGNKLKGTWVCGKNKLVVSDRIVDLNGLQNQVYYFDELFTLRRDKVSFQEALDYLEQGKGNPVSCNNGQVLDEWSSVCMKNIKGEWYINV